MIKGAIFDLDGTLLDSMFLWDSIAEDYLRSLDILPKENLNKAFEGFTMADAANYYRTHYGVALSVEEIIDGVNAMIAHKYETEAKLKPGAAEYLLFLRERGVKICVATATDRTIVERTLGRLGVLDFFEGIFTCAEVGRGKDKPDIYRAALDILGTKKEETLVFEDALFALKTAKADGFFTVGVYDKFEKRQAELARLADVYIRDFRDPKLKKII